MATQEVCDHCGKLHSTNECTELHTGKDSVGDKAVPKKQRRILSGPRELHQDASIDLPPDYDGTAGEIGW